MNLLKLLENVESLIVEMPMITDLIIPDGIVNRDIKIPIYNALKNNYVYVISQKME